MTTTAATLQIIVGAQTGDAEAALKRTDIATNALGSTATAAAARAAQLSSTLELQQRQLGLLSNDLAALVTKHGEESAQVAKKQLAIDRVTASMRANETQLQRSIQQIADEREKLTLSAKAWDVFGEIATGALHKIGSLGVQALLDAGHALEGLVGDATSAYTAHELLGASYDSLIAKELLHSGAAKDMSEALGLASGKSAELLQWNQQLAVHSPFNEEGISKAFQLAQAYGFVSETASKTDVDAKRLVQTLVDFSAGAGKNAETIDRVTLALGQIQAKGKLAGQEMNQLSESGVNVRQILSEAFGKSTAEITKMQEKGELVASKVIPAIVEALEKDFGGAAARQSETVGGLLNSLEDLKQVGLREFFAGTFQAIQPLLKDLVDTLSNPQTQADIHAWGESLGAGFRDAIASARQMEERIVGVYTAMQPVFSFVRDEATPALYLLEGGVTAFALASVTRAIPAILETSAALIAQAPVLIRSAAAYGAIAIAVAGVISAYEDFEHKIQAGSKALLDSHEWWVQSTDALGDYGKASKSTQATLKDEAAALENQRRQIQANLEQLAAMKVTGQDQGTMDRKLAAINAEADALATQTSAFRTQIATLESGAPAYVTYTANTTRAMSATDATTQAVALSADALDKLHKELEKIEGAGGKAFATLQRTTADYQAQVGTQQQAHQDKLQQIDSEANAKRAELEQAYQQKVVSAQADGQQKQTDLASDHAAKLAQIAQDTVDKRADAERSYQEKVQQIASDGNEKRASLDADHAAKLQQIDADGADKRAALEQAYQQKVADLQADGADKRAALDEDHRRKLDDLQQSANDKSVDLQHSYQDKLDDIDVAGQRKAEAEAESHSEKLQELERDTGRKLESIAEESANRIDDLRRDAGRSLENAEGDHGNRLSDLQENGQEKQADLTRDHERRLADLQRDLGKASTDAARAQIQERIASENEAYGQRSDDLKTDLQRQIDDEQKAYDRKRAAIAEKLQQEIDDQRIADERKRQAAAESLKERQDDENAAYAQRQSELQTSLTQQRAAAAEAYDHQRADLQTQLDHQRGDEAVAYARRNADLQTQLADTLGQEQTGYQRRSAEADSALVDLVAKEQSGYAQRVHEAETALGKQTTAVQTAYTRQIADLTDHEADAAAKEQGAYEKRQADAQQALDVRLSDERASYAQRQSELDAALSTKRAAEDAADAATRQKEAQAYADRILEQRRALGEQLLAYVGNLEEQHRITPEKAGAITAALRTEYGIQQTLAESTFGAATSAIDKFATDSAVPINAVKGRLHELGDAGSGAQIRLDALREQSVAALTKDFQSGKIDLDTYIDRLNHIPSKVSTEVELRATGDWLDVLGRVQGTGGTPYPVSGQRAAGGPVEAGRYYLVGERGPEIVGFGADGHVFPSGTGPAAQSGDTTIGSVTIVVQGSDDPQATAIAVREEFLRMQQRGPLGFVS